MVKINIAFNKQTTKNQFFKKKKYIYTLFESASSIKKLVRILFWKSYIEFRGLLLQLDIRCINNIHCILCRHRYLMYLMHTSIQSLYYRPCSIHTVRTGNGLAKFCKETTTKSFFSRWFAPISAFDIEQKLICIHKLAKRARIFFFFKPLLLNWPRYTNDTNVCYRFTLFFM